MVDFVGEYDQLLASTFQKYLSLSQQIGGVVKEQADLVSDAFQAQRNLVMLASQYNKPASNDQLQLLMKPMSDKMIAIQSHRENNRTSEFFNHLSAVSESITVLGWIVVTPDPSKFAKELHGAGAYYGNKVITSYKNKNVTHSDWAKTWLDVLMDLHSYIREYHRCGLSWNTQAAVASVNAPVQTAVPAPPPPPPPSLFDAPPSSKGDDIHAALFKEINQGADITKCLKRVELRDTQDKQGATVHSAKWHKPTSAVEVKPAKFVLEGRKWCIEHQQQVELQIPDSNITQSVYVYKCNNFLLTVEKKVNCITLDSCKKTSIVFSDIVSSVEFINCQNMKAQALGILPTVMVDKTDGFQLYLNENALGVKIISSKSSELNILVPKDDDYVELPVPEQLQTVISNGKLETTAIDKS